MISKKYAVYSILILSLALGACKKNKNQPKDDTQIDSRIKQTATTNRTELTNDSLFLYARELYYWNTTLPTYDAFEPRKYKNLSSNLDNYDQNLFNIVKSSASADYVASDTYPKYSYIEDITAGNPNVKSSVKASVDLQGNGNDIGIMALSYAVNGTANGYLFYIGAVYRGSDAETKGVKRGWTIKRINGKSYGANFDTEIDEAFDELAKSTVRLEGNVSENGIEGAAYDITLSKTNYKSNPIYTTKVITSGSKKIGYIAYGRFSSEANSVQVLNNAFNDFGTSGVTDLVVDLRYNGGGYISTAQHLVNLIAPSTATGVMYKEYYNATMQNKKATILKNQPYLDEDDKIVYQGNRMKNLFDDVDYSVAGNTYSFSKTGNLTGVKNVVFLVTNYTASASELVINSLKPKMTVSLVGLKTYGKPIGFFPIRLENRYNVYYSLFETKNSLDQGGYFSGMTPDYFMYENPRYEFGNENEPYLAKAISILNPGAVAKSGTARTMGVGSNARAQSSTQNLTLPIERVAGFVGMIEDRRNLKK